jgi:uncharacterized protein (DUF169 family)
MATLDDFNRFGENLERQLNLRSSPLAIKMLEKGDDIPEGAIRPKRDWGEHYAQCQAFAMSRRQGASIAMMKEDNWCWGPLIGYGMEDFPEEYPHFPFMIEDEEASENHRKTFPRLERGKYIGIVSAPLKTANFYPDLILVYSNTAQLRSMLMAIKVKKGHMITSQFDPIDSCIYSIVPVLLTGQYRITLPDPGEYERAMAGEDEIILSVPKNKMEELISGLNKMEEMKLGYRQLAMHCQPDFPRPDFYRDLFRIWGLDIEDNPVPWRRLDK